METLTPGQFRRLAQVTDTPCVSVLMPTHSAGPEVKQDPIRFKNLLKQAEERLVARGVPSADARKQLASLRKLVEDTVFWSHQESGLAAYCTPEDMWFYKTPFALPERTVVGSRCYLVPLIPAVSEFTRFYVLALSPKQVRLLDCTHYSAEQLDLPGWPEDFNEFMQYFEEQSQLQFHTGGPPTGDGGNRVAVFHGHPGGDESSERKQRLLEYCRLIDQRVRKAVGPSRRPLVLACDERLAAIYRDAADYPGIVETPITGNPDSRKPGELREQAWKLIEPKVAEQRRNGLARYQQAAANGRAARGLADVLPAAQDGRVESLLVAENTTCWGQYDADHRSVEIAEEAHPEDEELVNLAAVAAYLHGSAVHAFPRDELPEEEPALAVLRF